MNVSGKKVIFISESGRTPKADEIIHTIVAQGPSMVAFHGKDCELLHDICDEVCVGDGSAPKDIMTTWHSDETLAEVTEFVRAFEQEELGDDIVTVKI